ncbi:hypothetical protein ACHAXS_011152 [Conticribra weissflogii]
MMPWPQPCTPCILWLQLLCKPCLEDLHSLKICFSTFLSLQIGMPFLHTENNWLMMLCSMPTKRLSILTTRLVKSPQ